MTLTEIFSSLPEDIVLELEKQLDSMPVPNRFIETEGIVGHYVTDVEKAAWDVAANMKLFMKAKGYSDITLYKIIDSLPEATVLHIFGPKW